MFLAIINDTYAEVKSELEEQKDDLQISEFFMAVRNSFYKMVVFGKI
jgi:hypothetical protein